MRLRRLLPATYSVITKGGLTKTALKVAATQGRIRYLAGAWSEAAILRDEIFANVDYGFPFTANNFTNGSPSFVVMYSERRRRNRPRGRRVSPKRQLPLVQRHTCGFAGQSAPPRASLRQRAFDRIFLESHLTCLSQFRGSCPHWEK